MSEWTTATLGEIAKIITGPYGSQLHQSDYVEDGYPLIMPQNIGDRTLDYSKIAYISEKDAKRLSRYATKPNDIVYSRRGNIEKHAFITELGTYCGTGCFLVRFKTNDIEPLFMSFYLNLPKSKEWLKQNSVGSNMMNLNTDILKAIPISYPNKKTQLAIARFLNNIDRKIALNKAISAELDSTARMLYDYWFTQFDFPDENGKPYRASGGVMVWSEELKREIPKDWNVKPIKQCIVKISTGLNPRQNFILGRGSNRYVTIKNIENGHLDLNKCDFVDDEALIRIHARSDIKVGDILFTSIEPIGRLYLINETP
ncbi:MAG: restriction endonuclease subunit S, partial [Dehalobacterium sp.]